MSDRVLSFPAGTDFNTWQKFYRSSSDAEVTAIVLTRILGYPEAAVAEGFSVSAGTMKYRVAKGIRQLGAVLSKTGSAI
jgi:DNA-directed RNA polymerase specialized sigma24 family protein